MALPSYVKITRNGITYEDGADRASYCIEQLTRAAMRDIAKLLKAKWREAYRANFRQRTKTGVKNISSVVPKIENKGDIPYLEIGYMSGSQPSSAKPFMKKMAKGFYAAFQEQGTKFHEKRALLFDAVNDNLEEVRRIEAAYLSAISDADDGESLIDEENEGVEDDAED